MDCCADEINKFNNGKGMARCEVEEIVWKLGF